LYEAEEERKEKRERERELGQREREREMVLENEFARRKQSGLLASRLLPRSISSGMPSAIR